MKKSTVFLLLGILCFAEFFYLGILTDFVKKEVMEEYVILAFICLLEGITCLIIWKYASSNRT
jgi:hypothetical protein